MYELRTGLVCLALHCNAGDIRKWCEGTLERLQIDCIDLYMVHWYVVIDQVSKHIGKLNAVSSTLNESRCLPVCLSASSSFTFFPHFFFIIIMLLKCFVVRAVIINPSIAYTFYLYTNACIHISAIISRPIDKNSMAHFAGDAKTAHGGRDYAVVDHDATPEAPPTEKAFKELMVLQKEGKIKHIGVSNFGVNQLKEALATGVRIDTIFIYLLLGKLRSTPLGCAVFPSPCSSHAAFECMLMLAILSWLPFPFTSQVKIAINQLCYNLIFRSIEFEILPFCVANGIGVIAYSPLMQGILTGNYATADDVPVYRVRSSTHA